MREDYEMDEYGRPYSDSARPQYASEVHGVREAAPVQYWEEPVGGGALPPQAPPPYYAPPQAYAPEYYVQPPDPRYGPPQYYAPVPQAPPEPEGAEEEREERRSGPARWAALVFACAVIGVVIGVGIVAILKFVNGPVTAKATADPLEAARESSGPTPSTNVFQGKQIYLKYPSVFDSVGESRQSAGLDSFMISAKANAQTTIAVAVVPLTTMLIDDDSSYKYRSVHPEQYSTRQLSLGGEKAYLMSKTDKTEATLFWPHKGKDLNLSITSTDPHVSPADTMNQIVPTIRWLQ